MRDPLTHWLSAFRLWAAIYETWFHSGITIASRMNMVGGAMLAGRPLPAVELARMVEEKQHAALSSAIAAMAPYQRATRANARRLSRKRS
jgi:hypothetical protein